MAARIARILIVLAGFVSAGAFGAEADDIVRFNSATYPPTPFQIALALQHNREAERIPGQPLTGRLKRPAGDGPFPAIVVLHGCGGIWRWNDVWSERLVGWGYAVLDVDSLGPRGMTSVCDRPGLVSGEMRALDAHGAKTFMAGLAFVDPARIAVLGMSHGGWGVLNAIHRTTTSALELPAFKAAVALYPWCDDAYEIDAPLLILMGQLDDWSPAVRCEAFVASAGSSRDVTLKVYPGAHHLFDLEGINTMDTGHVLRYAPQAADDALRRIAAFLARYL